MSKIGTHLKNEIQLLVGHTKCAACEQTCEMLNKMTASQVERHQWKIVAKIERNAMAVKCSGWKSALRYIDQSVAHGAVLRFVINGLLAAAIAKEKHDDAEANRPLDLLDGYNFAADMGGTRARTD